MSGIDVRGRLPLAAVIAVAVVAMAQGIIGRAPASLSPLTAADHMEIQALYTRTLHEAGVATGLRHWLTNLVAEPAPGGALGWAYIVRSQGAATSAAVLYRDRLAKGRAGWRVEAREEFPGTVMPPREHLLPPSNEDSKTFTARDFAEVKRLVTRYNLGYDNAGPFDSGVLSSFSFTLDAMFERPGGATRIGRDGAIVQAKEFQTKPGLHHWDTNFLIDVSPSGEVTSVNYDMQFNVSGSAGEMVNLRSAGLLFHRFTRTPEGWLINYRRYDSPAAVPKMAWPESAYGLTARGVAADPAAPKGGGALSGGDYVEIDQLYARANFAFDTGMENGAAFARTFTVDGSLVRAGVATTGHAALTALAAPRASAPAVHTWMSNLVIEPSRDGATGRVYALDFTSGAAKPVNDAGRFDDVLVRTPQGWRFKTRVYVSDLAVPPARGAEAEPHAPYTEVTPWGPEAEGGLDWEPGGAEADAEGRVYFLRRSDPSVWVMDPSGKVVRSFGSALFVWAHGLHVDKRGNVWATDCAIGPSGSSRAELQKLNATAKAAGRGHQVYKFSPKGKLLMTLGKAGQPGSGRDQFHCPSDVITAPDGSVFVSDGHGGETPNARILKFSRDGTFIKTWGRKGKGPGEFSSPHTFALDSRGRLFVGDRGNGRIQVFDLDGNFLDQFTNFGSPSGIAITAGDLMVVTDTGRHVAYVGDARTGQMTGILPDVWAEGVAADNAGNIYVGEVFRHRWRKFSRVR